ncbi:MAG: MFS transporter [Patescibacteria group bacterium]
MASAAETVIHDEQLNKKKIKLISFISFLFGFSQAILLYVMSFYFKLATGTENVGIFYTISYIIVLIILLNLHKLVRKIGKSNVFLFSLLAKIILVFFLTLLPPSFLSLLLLMGYIIFSSLEWTNLDVILESFSKDQMSGRIRGVHLTIFNLGFLLGPFLSTKILENMNFQGIFVVVLIFNAVVFSLALIGLRGVNHEFNQKLKVADLVKKVFRRKDVMGIYYISFVLEFFFALMVIYTPLYLLDIGFSWEKIGIVFTMMLIPFVLLQYPAGVLADKKIGEKEMIILAILIMAASTLGIYFIHSLSVLVWGAALFATRVGAALIEILRDSYFYKKIDGHDVDIINFMRTSMPVAYILSTAISTIFILLFSIKFAFILVSLVVLSALYPAFTLKDNKSEKELAILPR